MKSTVPAKVAKRKARDARLLEFDALADFANLGDKPEDWEKFRRLHPDFFPADMTKWIYINAEDWWNLSNLPDIRPADYRWILRRFPNVPEAAIAIKNWAKFAGECRWEMSAEIPPLLSYRDFLRWVWRGEDPADNRYKILLGFDASWPFPEEGAGVRWNESKALFEWKGYRTSNPDLTTTIGPFTDKGKETETFWGLPTGSPVVDRKTRTINWEIGCQFQRAVYYLMQERWRPKICSWSGCGKYFIAEKRKRAQKYCSTKCYGEQKAKKSLEHYHSVGKFKRQESKARKTKAHRRGS